MVSLLVFDADDTLYHWLSYYVPSFYEMAEEVSRLTGIPMLKLLIEYKAVHTALKNVEFPYATLRLPSVLAWYGKTPDQGLKDALAPAFLAFDKKRTETLCPFAGVKETLKRIKAMGIPMVIYTDAAPENARHRFEELGISQYFHRFYTRKRPYHTIADQYENTVLLSEAKPSPDNLRFICHSEGVKAEETMMVGDNIAKDIYMAHLAGTKSAWCVYGRRDCADLYQKLVAITNWTEEDFAHDRAQKQAVADLGITPTYTLENFSDLLLALEKENGK